MSRIEIQLPESVSAETDRFDLTVEGPEGTVTRRLWFPNVTVEVTGEAVTIETDSEDAKTNATMGTFESHVENMIHGVTEGFEYRMQIHYS
ncbi:MAG: 50S ribosomal protein L6, partial [Halodesulfurarchaeum sp.]|nr:50S ribosomal protein L6 [Halodesulfurarchaeum sp.]